jgi:hypothetical protein
VSTAESGQLKIWGFPGFQRDRRSQGLDRSHLPFQNSVRKKVEIGPEERSGHGEGCYEFSFVGPPAVDWHLGRPVTEAISGLVDKTEKRKVIF